MKIAIFGNTYKKECKEPIGVLFKVLQEKNACIMMERHFFDFLTKEICDTSIVDEIIEGDDFDANLALSVGGDGTFLNTAARIGNKNIPILGINTGRLGFLADVESDKIASAIDEIYDNNYFIEQRSVIQLKTDNPDFTQYPHALNEIAILKQDSSSMIAVEVSINGEFLSTYQADGLIVATTTGSTAYSVSVGGPVAVPQANNMIISPVASHSLNVRPLVIPASWTVELRVVGSRNNSFLVSLDGRSAVFSQEYKLIITRSDFNIRVVKRPEHTFFNALRNKLMWGIDRRN